MLGQALSDEARISLLTCSPGPQLYQSWGHSAVLVEDPKTGLEKIYNYGTFNFRTPGFYTKFVRGTLPYILNDENYQKEFLPIYKYYNQHVDQQILSLSPNQTQSLFNFLEHNLLPDHKYYMYDQFYDNCALRIKWALENILADSLRFNYSSLPKPKTFRQAIDDFLTEKHWIDFGIDLILGSPVDHTMNPPEYSFLPSFLFQTFENGEVLDSAGQWQPLILETQRVHKAFPGENESTYFTPLLTFSLLALLIFILTIVGIFRGGLYNKWIDIPLFGVYGIAGIILLLLWVGTDHNELAWNYNIVWLLPSHLGVSFLLFRQRQPLGLGIYLSIISFINISILFFWYLLPQSFHIADIPLILIITLRAFRILFYYVSEKKWLLPFQLHQAESTSVDS